jgi:hypothetical protein
LILDQFEKFALYTFNGAVSKTATLYITGDIGTDLGAISGFNPASVENGSILNSYSITAQADLDINAAVFEITSTTITALHIPVFGNGKTSTTGVYSQAATIS